MAFPRLILSLFIMGFVFAASCSDDTTTNNTSTNSITAKVDGVSWDGSAAAAGTLKSGQFLISGTSNGQQITISIYNITQAGTYSFGGVLNTNTAQVSEGTTKYWLGSQQYGSGTITISTLTSTDASGTFSFSASAPPAPLSTATGNRTVTDGSFSIKLTQI